MSSSFTAYTFKCIRPSYDIHIFICNALTKYYVCITEPKSGFRIAFNMFDTDGNQRVDKAEFLVVSTTNIYEEGYILYVYVLHVTSIHGSILF